LSLDCIGGNEDDGVIGYRPESGDESGDSTKCVKSGEVGT